MFHCDHIHIQPLFSQSTVVFLDCFAVVHIYISWSLHIRDRPVVLTVIENSRLRSHAGSNRLLDLLKSLANLCYFAENAGIISAIMIDHCTMELLRSSLALAKLEIQHAVRTMCYSLERCSQMHSRFFKFVDRFPVRCRRTGFHKKKWFLPDTAHQIMLHFRINCSKIFFFFVPAWIIIPRYHVQNILEFFVIQTVIIIHQICCYRQFRTTLADRINLIFNEVDCLVCHKSLPVKFQSMKFIFTFCGRTFNLVKAIVSMTPESSAPAFVKILDRAIFLFQPLSELRLTQWAVAFTAKFIGNMPQHNCRMFAESFR